MGILGRSLPIRPHVARPIVGAAAAGGEPLLLGFVVLQSTHAARSCRPTPLRPHLAAPIVGAFVPPPPVARGTFVTRVARDRSTLQYRQIQGAVVGGISFPADVVTTADPLLLGLVVGQAGQRKPPLPLRPHLARPLLGTAAPAPLPPALIVSQALKRALIRRGVARPHLAAATLTTAITAADPLLLGIIVGQTLQRAKLRTNNPRPHLARPIVGAAAAGAPVALGTFTNQAWFRSKYRSGTFLAAGQADPGVPPLRAALVISQATERATRRPAPPRPHLPKPVLGAQTAPGDPLLLGLFVSQASQRKPRPAPRPHIARPTLAAQPFDPATIVSQARARALVGRTIPKPHLATSLLGQVTTADPLLLGVLVSQALQRSKRRDNLLRPHLAKPITATTATVPPIVTTSTFIGQSFLRARFRSSTFLASVQADPVDTTPQRPAVVVSQAVERAARRAGPPRPHLAPPIVTAAQQSTFVAPDPIVVGQARARALIGRSVTRAHLAAPTLQAPFLAPDATIVSQAKARPLVGRTSPRPHLAPVNLAQSPFRPATVISQAHARPRPGPPQPHTARPVPPFRAPSPRIVGQARARALVGRTCPHAHYAQPSLAPQPFPPGNVITQSRQRMLVGRRVVQAQWADPIVDPVAVGLVQFDNDRFVQRITNGRFVPRIRNDRFTGRR